jgi:DNA (cytosine-5)-methyltransferase 1
MRTVAFCERDEFCRAVLAKHWPAVPCFDDVRTLDASRLGGLGRIDLVCGGFPCQPFSQAGKQRAEADDRYLWPAMREVIACSRPSWVIGENVAGIVALALDDVLADLEGLGYASRSLVIPACAVDAKHRRDRVWIVARDTHGKSKPASAVDEEMAELRGADSDPDGQGLEGRDRSELPERQAEWPSRARGSSIADPDREGPLPAAFPGVCGREARTGARNEQFERPCGWEPEPNMGRVAHGVPRRVDRLRALGNAVVPQVVEEIGRAIMQQVTCSERT